jgi:3-phenylpropionate/cinnamic acid dioxygenase small subunit
MAIDTNELVDFVYKEAALLDEEQYQEWLALFAEDGRYWVPLHGARQEATEKRN